MKQKLFSVLLLAALSAGCGNGDSAEDSLDTANTLNDTFPAGTKGAVLPDSHPPDATRVDSMSNLAK